MKEITIKDEFINLGQFLKIIDLVSSGGETKIFLAENTILVNENIENRRGKKLYRGDIITVLGEKYIIC